MAIAGLQVESSSNVSLRNHTGVRACDFCPTIGSVEHLTLRPTKELKTSLGFNIEYAWMAGGSSHKLKMMREISELFPELVRINRYAPVTIFNRYGSNVTKAIERPEEFNGLTIASEKLDHYWDAFISNPATRTCRKFRHNAHGCAPDHMMFATDVNLWVNRLGLPHAEGVYFRNPDEENEQWKDMKDHMKKDLIVDFITRGYKQIGENGLVTNMVETALAMRTPRGRDWNDQPFSVSGASRMAVTMPLDLLTDRKFVHYYVDSTIAAMLTNKTPSVQNESDALNSMGGAAGGILIEHFIRAIVDQGGDVTVALPAFSSDMVIMLQNQGENIGFWDQVRGHASGVPHAVAFMLFTALSRNTQIMPFVIRPSMSAEPVSSDIVMTLNKQTWKEK